MGAAKLRREKPMISILIPERGRPVELQRCIWSLIETADNDSRYEILVAIDDDDPAWTGVGIPMHPAHVHFFTWPRPLTLGQKINQLAKEASGDILHFISNDRVMLTEGWPTKFREAVAKLPNGIGVAYPQDPQHPDHSAFPITRMPVLPRKSE